VNQAQDARATIKPNQYREPDARERLFRRRWAYDALIMLTFQIAGYLTEFTGGHAEIELNGNAATVGEALDLLWYAHTGLRDRVLTEQGHVRPHVNIFVNSQVINREQVLQIPIAGDADICIMPAVSGGA
jgi:molybdopterin converting factor small subunit